MEWSYDELISHNKTTSISPQLDLCSTLAQHSFFVYGHCCSSTNQVLLKITNRSFQYTAPYLWNQLPTERRERRQVLSPSRSSITHGSLSSLSPLSSYLTRSFFHSELKTWLFMANHFHHAPLHTYRTDSTESLPI